MRRGDRKEGADTLGPAPGVGAEVWAKQQGEEGGECVKLRGRPGEEQV